MRFINQFSFPFDHVVLITKIFPNIKPEETECECINISLGRGYCAAFRPGKGVRFGRTKMRISGYSYFRLELTGNKYSSLINICRRISKEKTSFDHLLQYRLKTPMKPIIDQPKWICSQLVGFLLQEIGVIPPEVNSSRLSPTDVFLLLFSSERGCSGGPCEDPFRRGGKGETSMTVFTRHGGVRLSPDQRMLLNE